MTYRSWDDEPWEEIKERVEGSGKYGSKLRVRCYGDTHHTIVSEIEEGEEWNVEEPEEFCWRPLERHHWVHNKTIYDSLDEHIWYLHNNLNKEKNRLIFQMLSDLSIISNYFVSPLHHILTMYIILGITYNVCFGSLELLVIELTCERA